MYKDVWKKFGAKVFIVLCSILLVGGVAIAVPVLRAAPGGPISLGSIFSQSAVDNKIPNYSGPTTFPAVSGAALVVTNPEVDYAVSNKVVNTPLPKLEVQFNGNPQDKWELSDGEYNLVVIDKEGVAAGKEELQKAGDHTVYMQPGNIGNRFTNDSTQSAFKFKVKQIEAPGGADKISAWSENLITNNSGYLTTENIKVTVDGSLVDKKDYVITGEETNSYEEAKPGIYKKAEEKPAGEHEIFITFRNYLVDTKAFVKKTVTIKKNVSCLVTNLSFDPNTKEVTGTIMDKDYVLQEKDYELEYVYNDGDTEIDVKIKGKTNSSNYGGEHTVKVPVTTASQTVVPVLWNSDALKGLDGINGTIDYDKDYALRENGLQIKKELITGLNVSSQPYTGDFRILKTEIVDQRGDNAKVLKGRTAGIARMTLLFSGNRIGYIYYNVRRDIGRETVTLSVTPEGQISYTGTRNYKNPVIIFNGESSEPLEIKENDQDFRVHYWLRRSYGDTETTINNPESTDSNIAWAELFKAQSYAGTVHMDIYPKTAEKAPGYYGKRVNELNYDVSAIEVNKMVLGRQLISQTTKRSNFEKSIQISSASFSEGKYLDIEAERANGTEIIFSYTNTDTGKAVASNWETLPAGHYTVRCNVWGNYTSGSNQLSASFEVTQFKDISAELAGNCSTDDAKIHEWNERAHLPKVTLIAPGAGENGQDIVLEEGEDKSYIVRYSDNTEVGKAVANVFFTTNQTSTSDFTLPFQIAPRSILTEDKTNWAPKLYFRSENGFSVTIDDTYNNTFVYAGDNGRPALDKLRYKIQYDSEDVFLNMKKDTDYTVDADSGIINLYGKNGNEIDLTEEGAINCNDSYYFKIFPQGNFRAGDKGSKPFVLAGPFKFKARELTEQGISYVIKGGAYSYDKWDDEEDEIKSWIKENITVTDNGIQPARNLRPEEFSIEITKDNRKENGTIEFDIVGTSGSLYTKKKPGILNVGRNIAEAKVVEETIDHDYQNVFDANDELILQRTNYVKGGPENDPYSLNFGGTASGTAGSTNLYFGANNIRLRAEDQGSDLKEYTVGKPMGPDYNNNGYVSVTLNGVNGYYGTVTIKFRLQVINITSTNFEIVFPDDARFIYDGLEKEPKNFTVYDKRDDDSPNKSNKDKWKEVPKGNYKIVKYDKNIKANEQYGDSEQAKLDHWAIVIIEGIAGYEGSLTGYFKIERRNISGIDRNTQQNNWILNTDYFSFSQGSATDVLQPVDYIPESIFYNGALKGNGGWSDIKLYYSRTGTFAPSIDPLVWNEDYIFYCTGGGGANKNDPPDKSQIDQGDNPIIDQALFNNGANAGTAYAVVKGKGNFKGVVIKEYTVREVDFNDENDNSRFIISIGNEWQPFTGKDVEPAVDIVQERGGQSKTLVRDVDYEVEYGPNVDKVFISKNYDNDENQTYMLINGKGNYKGQLKQRYVIYGQLTEQNTIPGQIDPAENSMLSYEINSVTGTKRIRYKDDPNILYSFANLGLQFRQRREGGNFGALDSDGKKNSDDYSLNLVTASATPGSPQIKGDYNVEEGSQKEIGKGIIHIKGNFERGKYGIIEGSAAINATIWEDLSTIDGTSEELWREKNNGSKNITVTGSAITIQSLKTALANALTINCGGRELLYERDYVFDEKYLDTNIGVKKTARIIPSKTAGKEGDWYLDGYAAIEYNLTSNISGATIGRPIGSEFIYNHGTPLVKSTADLNIVMNGNTLKNPTDYAIEIKNQETSEIVTDAIDAGSYTYTIRGKGSYGGSFPQGEFVIKQYSLTDNKDKVTVVLEKDRVDFNADRPALPTVTSVLINIGNTSKELNDENFNGGHNYHVEPGSKGSNVNWTDVASGDEQPVVEIHGDGNYTGFVEKPYFILQKDITDDDIIIEEIKDQIYNNNIPITPVPQISWVNKEGEQPAILLNLNPTLHDASVDYNHWKNYDIHFAYKYLDDTKDSGKKTIHIYGIGNFKGEAEITYTVKPLNLKDTKLTFLSDEVPVYDGTKQKPAFKLSYGNIDNILTVRDGKPVSTEYLKASNVTVEYVDNVDATTEEKKARVTVKLVEGSTANYEGEITREFTILPAPLESHVRFMYRPKGSGGDVDLRSYKLSYPFKGVDKPVYPIYAQADAELAEDEIGMYYDYPSKANHGKFLVPSADYGSQEDPDGINIEYKYVEPDTDDTDIREEYQRPTPDYAGKVRVTITGKGNYSGKASFWYFIGDDISSDAKISISPTTAVFNSQNQYPTVTISGVDKNKCTIGNYRGEVLVENLITDKDFIDAGTYFIRVEGDPSKGTYATKPETLTFTITPRAFSNSLVIDGFKKEYAYTGYEIRPVGISVTDYIDNIKYRLTEEEDYVLTYSNNLNAGIAYINVKGQGNFSGSASTNFLITSSTISSGGWNGSNSFLDEGSGEISGAVPVAPNNVKLTMDTSDAMYYTGKAVYPKVSISGMTENVDYTVTFSNNVEVGMGVATINGIGNNNGVITKNFRIIAPLSKCTISPIPAQQYTGSAVTPSLTVRCGNTVLMEGTDYTVTYSNNINIGTATATIRALNNANFTGSASVKFSIGNDVGGFIISGFAPSYAYTGNAITPGVVVETGSSTLTLGTDYTVSYSNNVNAGTATITVTGTGKYSGTQTANFIIEAKSIQSCDTTEVTDRTYTGDAYTPDITVSDGGKVLTKGVDYTVTYTNNTNPGTASILIQGMSNNYTGTKVISFKISAVAVKGLKSSSVKYNSLKLAWTKQGYADGYQICNSSSKVVKTVKKNSASITGLSAGKTYKYKVRSYVRNADGTKSYGAFSSVLSVTTKLRTPTVKVVSNAKGQARISWSKVSGASGYEIYYKKSSKAKYKKLKTVNNPNVRVCTVRGMKSGDRAYFRIRAFRKNGSKKVYSALNPLKVITVK